MAAQKILTMQINAETEEQVQKIATVLRNVANKVPTDAFCNVLYPKIQKNPDFFKSVVNHPMLKLFK
ncbi:MAG: hypothetical protein II939_10205 [Bacteroidales bacterium]|nr:hypothetical protein [Bacteroidales bacterium]